MRLPLSSQIVTILVLTHPSFPLTAQNPPTIPPAHDPAFWGRANQPYTLTETRTSPNPTGTSQPHAQQLKLYRDAAGLERTDSFYDSGQLMTFQIRDPSRNTKTILKVVEKRAYILYPPPPMSPGQGWTAERLQPRIIAGLPAEGTRYTRNTSPPSVGKIIEENWLSAQLGVILEQTIDDPIYGKTTRTVTQLQQAAPNPALFVIPTEYVVRQIGCPPSARNR